jgi:hypothetical protein
VPDLAKVVVFGPLEVACFVVVGPLLVEKVLQWHHSPTFAVPVKKASSHLMDKRGTHYTE